MSDAPAVECTHTASVTMQGVLLTVNLCRLAKLEHAAAVANKLGADARMISPDEVDTLL